MMIVAQIIVGFIAIVGGILSLYGLGYLMDRILTGLPARYGVPMVVVGAIGFSFLYVCYMIGYSFMGAFK